MSAEKTLLRRAHDLREWYGFDEIRDPRTPDHMNEIRQLLIDICAVLERLDP